MRSKLFNDGNRLILILEDCPEDVKNELISKFNPELVSDIEADTPPPLAPSKAEEQLISEKITLLQSSSDAKEKAAIFKELSAVYIKDGFDSLKPHIRKAIGNYLYERFKDVTDDKVDQLEEVPVYQFVDIFGDIMASTKGVDYHPDIFKKLSLVEKKSVIKKFVNQFRK